jgi:hypothetical protein
MPTTPPRQTNSTGSEEPEEAAPWRSDPAEAAHYIASLTGELSSLAKQSGLGLLGYLLDIVRVEAEKQARSDR